MTLAAEQPKAEKNLYWLLEVEGTYRIEGKTWTQATSPNTACWWMDHSAERIPSRVFQMLRSTHVITDFGTIKGSIEDCQAAASSFFYDAAAGRLYVHMSGGDAPDTAAKYYLRSHFWVTFTTHQYKAPYTILDVNGFPAEPRFCNAPAALTQEINDFSVVGMKEAWGSIIISNGDAKYDAWLGDGLHLWDMCRFNLKVGAKGDAYAALITVLRGRTGSTGWNDENFEFRIEDQLRAED